MAHLDGAREDDEERVGVLAVAADHLPRLVGARGGELTQCTPHALAQHLERLHLRHKLHQLVHLERAARLVTALSC